MKELHNVRYQCGIPIRDFFPTTTAAQHRKIPSIRFANLNSIDLDFPGLLNYNNTQAGGLPCS